MTNLDLPLDLVNMRTVEAGEIVFLEGQNADAAYVILRGHADVVVTNPTTCELMAINTMGPGELFGEVALITDSKKRSATVMAKDRCELLQIDRGMFDSRLAKADPLLRFVMEHLTRRLVQLTDKIVTDHGAKK